MKNEKLNSGVKSIVAQAQDESKAGFAELLRKFEIAFAMRNANPTAFADALQELSTAIAFSVLRKLTDPQRKTAQERDTVSNSGCNPAMRQLRIELARDTHDLQTLVDNACKAWDSFDFDENGRPHAHFNEQGDAQTIVDADAMAVIDALASETLGDGLDLANECSVKLLELADEHSASGGGWLEQPFTIRRVNRKVLIKDDTASIVDEQTTPIQEVYRHLRRYIADSRAVQTDPRNGYSYLEELATDEDGNALDIVYRRLNKYADLGGYDNSGMYTVDRETVADYNALLASLNPTDRQLQIINLRMQGYGVTAIASKLGIRVSNVQTMLSRLQKKCENIEMWTDMIAKVKSK